VRVRQASPGGCSKPGPAEPRIRAAVFRPSICSRRCQRPTYMIRPRVGHRAVSRFRTNPNRWDIRFDDHGAPSGAPLAVCGGSRNDD
jgi:hypothetical protein